MVHKAALKNGPLSRGLNGLNSHHKVSIDFCPLFRRVYIIRPFLINSVINILLLKVFNIILNKNK